jgi:hypothetical protein
MHKYRILGIFANHTNSIVKYNITINNISIIKEYLSGICIVDSLNEKYANLLKNDLSLGKIIQHHFLIENNNYFDFGKWIYALNNINYDQYDYIVFINDSIIVTEVVNKFFIHINYSLSNKVNLFAYNDSTQFKYHYQTYLFLLNKKIINKFIQFFDNRKKNIYDLISLVQNIELNICDIDENHDCFIKIANDYNMDKNIFWENEILYQYLLSKDIFGIMKLKKIKDIQNNYKINIYGHSIDNFNYYFYKNNYPDLSSLGDKDLIDHFIGIGQYEGRIHDYNTINILPNYYRKNLEKLGLLYFFDVPENFDVYFYKVNNKDISGLSNIDSMFHYINCGIYEGRTYNSNKNKISMDDTVNIFYKNAILKLNLLKNVSIPPSFNIFTHILFNNQYDNYFNVGSIINYNTSNNVIQLYKKDDYDKYISNFNVENYRKDNNLKKIDNIRVIQHYFYTKCSNNILLKIPDDFDINLYKKINSDLITISDDKIMEHYINYGIKEKRLYKLPNDFNYQVYQKIYKDLNNLNKNQLEDHYLMKGYKENRIYNISNNFNINDYKKIYSNIDNLNMDEIKILNNEILKNGLPSDFDCMTYSKIYNDLTNLNKKQLENHYIKYGMNEGRIYKLPLDFDYITYKKIYRDLIKLNEDELKDHFLYTGYNKGRIYKIPDDFDVVMYKNIYKDLSHLNNEQLKEHYLSYGIHEKRIYKLPNDFDSNIYKKIYKELSEMSKDELIEHYLYKGISENKIYKLPDDFDPIIYKSIFKDLDKLNNEELKKHYLYNGIHEKRIYKITSKEDFENFIKTYKNPDEVNVNNFNKDIDIEYTINKAINDKNYMLNLPDDFSILNYKLANKDLSNLSNDNLKKHYIDYGCKEKRIYKLPSDFNTFDYKIENKDLSNLSDEDLKKHYLEFGYKEKRIYKKESK